MAGVVRVGIRSGCARDRIRRQIAPENGQNGQIAPENGQNGQRTPSERGMGVAEGGWGGEARVLCERDGESDTAVTNSKGKKNYVK